MFGLSVSHLLILSLVVVILFGRGRVSETMGDFGKGIREFRRGMGSSGDGAMQTDHGLAEPTEIKVIANNRPID